VLQGAVRGKATRRSQPEQPERPDLPEPDELEEEEEGEEEGGEACTGSFVRASALVIQAVVQGTLTRRELHRIRVLPD